MIAIKCLKGKINAYEKTSGTLTHGKAQKMHKVIETSKYILYKKNYKKANIMVSSNYFMNGCTGRKQTNKQIKTSM